MAIENLPPELLSYLLSFLPGRDLASACLVCRKFSYAISVDSVWHTRCKREFGIKKINGDRQISFHRFYTNVLYKYGRLLGLWKAEMGSYGGLFQVMIKGDRLIGVHWMPPVNPHVHKPLRQKQVFSVHINDNHKTEVLCHKGFVCEPHHCQLISANEQEGDRFYYKCLQRELHRHPEGKEQEFSEWVKEETGDSVDRYLFFEHAGSETVIMKFITTIQYENGFALERLHLPQTSMSTLVPPGLFKGHYGGHGIEIVMLTYDEENNKANVVKISGDPNIPAGQVSIKVDLSRPMILNLEQQNSMVVLEQIDIPDLPPDSSIDKLPPQPFRVPAGCYERVNNVPRTCKARFHSWGQVAQHGFADPSFIPGHCVVFDEDNFGHLWLELSSFSLYSRVKEDLNAIMVDE